jgi:dTMP kinase
MGGYLIVFEGIDRCGKTTQVNCLFEYLRKKINLESVIQLKHPNRLSPSGKLINQFLLKQIDMSNDTISLILTSNLLENG